ncbi:MAG: hypothetical protein ACF8XB_11660 [Planctomycetota bacterium JB042]
MSKPKAVDLQVRQTDLRVALKKALAGKRKRDSLKATVELAVAEDELTLRALGAQISLPADASVRCWVRVPLHVLADAAPDESAGCDTLSFHIKSGSFRCGEVTWESPDVRIGSFREQPIPQEERGWRPGQRGSDDRAKRPRPGFRDAYRAMRGLPSDYDFAEEEVRTVQIEIRKALRRVEDDLFPFGIQRDDLLDLIDRKIGIQLKEGQR